MRRRRSRRALIRAGGGLLLFGAGLLAGFSIAGQTAPRRLREAVEASLSHALGTQASVEEVRVGLRPKLTIEAAGVTAWPGPSGPALTAERLEATLDPASLLVGRVRLSSLALDGVRLALLHGADGHWTPPLLTPGFENPLVVLGRLFAAALPAPTVDVRSGHLTITDAGGASATGQRFEIDGLSVRLLARGLLEPGRLRATGILRETKRDGARFELDVVAPRSGAPRLELAIAGLDLARFAPYLRNTTADLEVLGVASGVLGLEETDDAATRLVLDLSANEVRARIGRGADRRTLAGPAVLGAEGRFEIARDAFSISDATLRAGDLALRAQASIERPFGEEARLALDASAGRLEVATLREIGAWLPASLRPGFERAARNVVSGRVETLSLSGDAPIGAWLAAVRDGDARLPAGAQVEARVADLVLQPPGDEPIVAVRGRARLDGAGTLTVFGLEGRLGERALPILDLRLEGLPNLLAAAEAPAPAVAPALPGRTALEEIIGGGPPGDETGSGWRSLDVDADWLLHPALFRPLYAVSAHFEPTPSGVSVRLARGSWGGVPLRGEGEITTAGTPRVRLALAAGPSEGLPLPPPAPESWAHGHFALERIAAPGLHIATLRGGFDLSGTRLTLFDASATLASPGRLTGHARLDLAQAGQIGAQLRFELEEARVPDLLALFSDDAAQSSGSVDASARLAGTLRPGMPLLADLEGDARITARDGELSIELPLLLAIAKASTTFNPFGSASGLRFDRIDTELRVEGGRLATTRTVSLESPDLRLALSGSVDVRERPHRLEAVVGCFFFKPLDQVLGIMPFVSRILLGPDRSLFGTYFELTGSWEDPEAGLLPLKTVALGPASFLLEDVPSFVKRGLAGIQRVLLGEDGPPAVASPAELAAPAGDGS